MPSIPGGHQPAPMAGICASTQSMTLSAGFNMASRALFSEPPPLAATVTATLAPGTIRMLMTAGVLSRVLPRPKSGSATTEARKGLSGSRKAWRTPALTASSKLPVKPSQRTSMPTSRNTLTMPVSWQIGRRPMAAMRELARICAMALRAGALASFS